MKKVLSVLIVLVVFSSCSNEENNSSEYTQETGLLQAVIGTDTQSRTDVKRGNIHAWVDEVTIKATSTETGYVSEETYQLLDQGEPNYGSASSVFELGRVALGYNKVIASSTTDVVGLREFKINETGTKASWINNHVNNTLPYAVYSTDEPVDVEVLKAGTQPISLEMNTQNARLIAAISMDPNNSNAEYLTDNFVAKVKAEITDSNGNWVTLLSESGNETIVITDDIFASFYLSDEYSIGGTVVRFTVEVQKPDGTVISEDDRTVTLRNSTSYRCNFIYKTNENDLFGDVEMSLIWQDWSEEGCPGC